MRTEGKARSRLEVVGDRLRTALWPVPALFIVVAVALGVAVPMLDSRLADGLPDAVVGYLFSGGPEAARSVLAAVAGSLITVTSLTFSLTIVTLQLASSQYSPRLLRTFSRDGMVHATLAVLLGTFTYALTVMRAVRSDAGTVREFVPQLSVTLAYLLALVSVVMVALFLAHLAQKIRVESMLRDVYGDSRVVMRRVLPESAPQGSLPQPVSGGTLLCARSSGFLTHVDEKALLAAAVHHQAQIHVEPLPGDFIVAGTPVARLWRDPDGHLDPDALARLAQQVADAMHTGFERTSSQDVAFGLRQLVDVAVKALSPAVNDPTTATHALNHASALLCAAAQRYLGPRLVGDEDGRVRVVLSRPDFARLLDLVVSQPRRYGAGEPQVLMTLSTLLHDVAWMARDDAQRATIAYQLERLRATSARQDFDELEQTELEAAARTVELILEERGIEATTN